MTDTRVALPYLRAWRLYNLMTMAELAHAAGLSRDTVIQLELGRNRANLSTVGKLAAALHVSRRDLVFMQPPTEQPIT